jgi:hypothetical protein
MNRVFMAWVLAAMGAVGGSDAHACEYDAAPLLELDFQQFDQDHHNGWRALSYRATEDDQSCVQAAADLIGHYRDRHRDSLKPDQDRLLAWHAGQLYAELGDYAAAVPLLAESNDSPDRAFALYAKASVAFLQRDREALLAAREALAALPKPDNWDSPERQAERDVFKEKFGLEIRWPPNLEVVDSLVNCFARSYGEAYGGPDCRTPAAASAGE